MPQHITPQSPTIQRPSVRLVLAISLDGRLAPAQGGAAQLGGEGDRQALEQALAWADACLIGAGTLRAHQCTCLIRNPQLLEQRRREGRPQQPAAVVVSRSPDFSQKWLFFRQPLRRWLLSDGSDQPGFEVHVPPGPTWYLTLQRLAEQRLTKLVLLGGAGLTASMLQEDCIDELQFTLTPRLLGGAHCWLPVSQPLNPLPSALQSSQGWTLEAVTPLGGDELLVHYRRRRYADENPPYGGAIFA